MKLECSSRASESLKHQLKRISAYFRVSNRLFASVFAPRGDFASSQEMLVERKA